MPRGYPCAWTEISGGRNQQKVAHCAGGLECYSDYKQANFWNNDSWGWTDFLSVQYDDDDLHYHREEHKGSQLPKMHNIIVSGVCETKLVLENDGVNCYGKCGHTGGKCRTGFCGNGGVCCRLGWESWEPECDWQKNFANIWWQHSCQSQNEHFVIDTSRYI